MQGTGVCLISQGDGLMIVTISVGVRKVIESSGMFGIKKGHERNLSIHFGTLRVNGFWECFQSE